MGFPHYTHYCVPYLRQTKESNLLECSSDDATENVAIDELAAALRELHKICQRVVLQDL